MLQHARDSKQQRNVSLRLFSQADACARIRSQVLCFWAYFSQLAFHTLFLMTWNFWLSQTLPWVQFLRQFREKKMKSSTMRQNWKYTFGGSNIQHTLKDRYVISFSVSAPLELLMECISFITQRMCCIKRSLPIALKLNFSGSHDALSKESKMLQSKRSGVGKSPKQTSSSRKAKSLALLVAHGNCSLQGSVVW